MDYTLAARPTDSDENIRALLGVFPLVPNLFQWAHLRRLHHDGQLGLLEETRLKAWVARYRTTPPPYKRDVCDCDDMEALHRADRIRGRLTEEFGVPEAAGGIDYYSKTRMRQVHGAPAHGYHRAAWFRFLRGETPYVQVYQYDEDLWQDVRDEVAGVVYFDA